MYREISKEDILYEYQQTRLRNNRLLQERRNEIYSAIPRISEIDQESALSYVNFAREKIMGISTGNLKDISAINKNLEAEKTHLLLENGYPADYLMPVYDCPLCQDTGYINQEKCTCYIDKLINCLYLQSNLRNILDRENFDTFSTEYYSKKPVENRQFSPYDNIKNVIQRSKEFAASFEALSSGRGNILIYGETGLGKTFLTNCIAKELLDKKHSVLYLSSNELFENVLAGYIMQQKTELEDLYKYLYNCELLVIDDLGTELTNNFVLSQLFELINQRELGGMSTLISTNLSMKQLRDRYSERIMSRIIANYTVFNIYGENIRYQKRKKAINSTT